MSESDKGKRKKIIDDKIKRGIGYLSCRVIPGLDNWCNRLWDHFMIDRKHDPATVKDILKFLVTGYDLPGVDFVRTNISTAFDWQGY